MTKKVFTGERQNLPQLAEDVEECLRQQGFEVQCGAGQGSYLIQARKQSTWRSLLGNNQTIDVKIEGTPENYSIDVDSGQWVKNLADSGPAAIVAALATVYTLGIAAAWSASERSKIETELWALKDASCPSCYRIGASVATGKKLVRAEAVTQDASGMYTGFQVLTNGFKCKFCPYTWTKGEIKQRASVCPKCHAIDSQKRTGERIVVCKKTEQCSQNGQPIGEQAFRETFQCTACSHIWEGGDKSRLVELCPHCEQVTTGVYVGDTVLDRYTKHETRMVTEYHYRKKTEAETKNEGVMDLALDVLVGPQTHVEEGQSYRPMQFVVQYEVFKKNFKCNLCGKTWSNEQQTRQVE